MKFRFGKSSQDVTPRWASESTRSDGKTSTTYGKAGQSHPHGHSVRSPSGSIEYSRSIGGQVRADKK